MHFLTYLGGSCNDSGSNIALDATGNIWIAGTTVSPDFPLKEPFQATGSYNGGFVSELSADASQLLFSSFSNGSALALAPAAVYLAGTSGNSAIVQKIDPTSTPTVSIDSVGPVVAFPPASIEPATGDVAPGLLIQITGSNLGPAAKVNAQVDASGRLPFVLDNTIVYFDDIPAALISVQASAIVCYVPFETGPTPELTVFENGQRSNAVQIGVTASAPQILKVVNQDGSLNSAAKPAQVGSVIMLFVSGLGETNPLSADGLVNSPPLAVPLVPVMVYLPGLQIVPQFVGAAPGMIAGITQVNVPIPAALGTTPAASGISVNSASATLYVTR